MEKMLGGGESLMQGQGQGPGSSSSAWAQEFWMEKNSGGWMICTMGFKCLYCLYGIAVCSYRISNIVPDSDLKSLIQNLEEKFHENEKLKKVVDRRNNLLSYNARTVLQTEGYCSYLFSK
ncbi:hypothetical protein RJ640_009233 [Escallonia rubra]|uniref:Uncharacterized protein n=1 Tax=Escallonia rubra TaxID=112253 RepID=A0AA88RCT0_9ASTE|nr:hypothetical protein RJ640_009233 [Escallonia rubra]